MARVVGKKDEHRYDMPADVGFYLKTAESASKALGHRESGKVAKAHRARRDMVR
jgi:hypothetical protein